MALAERSIYPDMAAIVPAAGYSTRMQAFKPLLAFRGSTVIEQVVGTFRTAGVAAIVIVGWQADRLVPVLDRAGIRWVWNPRYADGMYASIQAGVRALPVEAHAFFVLPADMPLVRGDAVPRLLDAWHAQAGGILFPVWNGKRGHPPLLDARYVPEILADSPPGGLRTVLARHTDAMRDIPCTDAGILVDLDTPDEYERACGMREGS